VIRSVVMRSETVVMRSVTVVMRSVVRSIMIRIVAGVMRNVVA
jgi:hypothetical protein